MTPWLPAAIGLCVASVILVLVRRDRLRTQHAVSWIGVAVVFGAAGLLPALLDNLAGYLGVAYPPTLALTLGLAVLVVKILLMDIERSRVETRYQRLVQRVAMLEADLHHARQAAAAKVDA